jgi:hypothetical protein
MIAAAMEVGSYILRGTLLATLSQIAINEPIGQSLLINGFKLFKFGNHSCIIPINPESILIPVKQPILTIPQVIKSPSKYGQLAAQLLNPIHKQQASNELTLAAKENPADILTVENSFYIRRLLADHPFPAEQRQLLMGIFKGIPIMHLDQTKVDARLEAECRARLLEAQKVPASEAANYVFSRLPIPVLTPAEVSQKRRGSKAPEVYLSDSDFVATLRYDRNTFYRLPEEQRARMLASVFA